MVNKRKRNKCEQRKWMLMIWKCQSHNEEYTWSGERSARAETLPGKRIRQKYCLYMNRLLSGEAGAQHNGNALRELLEQSTMQTGCVIISYLARSITSHHMSPVSFCRPEGICLWTSGTDTLRTFLTQSNRHGWRVFSTNDASCPSPAFICHLKKGSLHRFLFCSHRMSFKRMSYI